MRLMDISGGPHKNQGQRACYVLPKGNGLFIYSKGDGGGEVQARKGKEGLYKPPPP